MSEYKNEPHIVIIGGGVTGLGAGVRLMERDYASWDLYEQCNEAGGLSTTYEQDGFLFDFGGHVLFSHYRYFDDVLDYVKSEWNVFERRAFAHMGTRWVPYPVQNYIYLLPSPMREECFAGLCESAEKKRMAKHDSFLVVSNFEEYFTSHFGAPFAKYFMKPYNSKVWGVPPSTMNVEWLQERVAEVDLEALTDMMARPAVDGTATSSGCTESNWGPNATFRYPKHGGTGSIYKSLAAKLPESRIHLGSNFKVSSLDPIKKCIAFADGREICYDELISTIPADELLRLLATSLEEYYTSEPEKVKQLPETCHPSLLRSVADKCVYSSTHVIGLGIRGAPSEFLRCASWLYFPEEHIPFYRATVFSNYAETNAPPDHWSLMLEVTESKMHHVPRAADALVTECIKGCLVTGLLTPEDEVVTKFHRREERGYPVPFLDRKECTEVLRHVKEVFGIYSRGRFGAWLYEVSNQDHSMMQGVESVDDILSSNGVDAGNLEFLTGESTLNFPSKANGKYNETGFLLLPPHTQLTNSRFECIYIFSYYYILNLVTNTNISFLVPS